ncbi:hypothetical protein [Larkinella punicea]|nr:hypothetical protein [Larkinella punicea]
MKKILFALLALVNFSCNHSFVVATLNNRNVYKTKANLPMKKAYQENRPSADQRDFTIAPNSVPSVTKTITTITTSPSSDTEPSQITKTVVVSTIPETKTTTTISKAKADPPSNATTTLVTTGYSVPATQSTNDFIRYKVVADEGDFKYVKVLPGCSFEETSPSNTNIIFNSSKIAKKENPEDYIFKVSKKDLSPNTHYLASSALIGKVITLPVRVRNEYWNSNNKILQGTLSIGYGFGWKYKLGNNPYKPHYLTTILYAAGISQQKHFSIGGKDITTGKDSISAKTDEIAVTYLSFGLAYEFDKFNIGIFGGKDKMFGNLDNWAYQDKWWWGIGIGYDLFK